MLSRFACVTLVPSISDWLEWAQRNGIHERVRRFVQANEQIFVKTNPRSFAYLSDMLATAEQPEDILLSAQSILQDKATALAFFHHYSGETEGTAGATPPAREEDLLKRLVTLDVRQLHELFHAIIAELPARKEPMVPLAPGDRVQVLYWEIYTGTITRIKRETAFVKNDEDGEVYDPTLSLVKKLESPA